MHGYQRKFFVAAIDLCKAFDSESWDSLWQFLRFRGMPDALISLLSAVYTGTESAIRCGSSFCELSLYIPVWIKVGRSSKTLILV